MSRVTPVWPDYAVAEVPQVFLRSGEQRVCVAVSEVDGHPAYAAIPFSVGGELPDGTIDRLVIDAFEILTDSLGRSNGGE